MHIPTKLQVCRVARGVRLGALLEVFRKAVDLGPKGGQIEWHALESGRRGKPTYQPTSLPTCLT